MSQSEIYTFLKDNPGKVYTARQLQDLLDIKVCVFTNLKKLRDKKEINYVIIVCKGKLMRGYYYGDEKTSDTLSQL